MLTSTKPVIEVKSLSKRYRIGELDHGSFKASLLSKWRRLLSRGQENSPEIIWALKDISFSVQRGEIVGVLGKNGAGKTTLFKILSRITAPTEGLAILRGQVSSILQVGTGFHMEFTGRENIYFSGSIHGMSKKEIDRKFDKIVAFSEVGKFIDTPLKRYARGMYFRLAFSVAVHLEPDILIVDEIFGTGDFEFKNKCVSKIRGMKNTGRTILCVTHNSALMSDLAERCFILEQGRLVFSGPAEEAIQRYQGMQCAQGPSSISKQNKYYDAIPEFTV